MVLRHRPRTQPAEAEDFGFQDSQGVNYHTREDFAVIHGADPADIALVETFAHEYSLTVTERTTARRSVVLTGTIENLQKAFGTTLAHYETPTGAYRGRTGSITIPAELQDVVTAVLGLDNRPVAKPHLRMAHAAAASGGLSPALIAQMYNFPAGAHGAGQTIGIIELGGGYRTSDLNTYFASLGIKTPTVSSVSVDDGANKPKEDKNSDDEVMLDIEVVGAVAPGAQIVVYFAPNTSLGWWRAIHTAISDSFHNPSVISISWGGPGGFVDQAGTQRDVGGMHGCRRGRRYGDSGLWR